MKILKEQRLPQQTRSKLIREFVQFCVKELGIKTPSGCKITLTNDKNKTETYGHFAPNSKEIVIHMGNRALSDSLRSLCHEMTHLKQEQEGRIHAESGKDGTNIENEANSKAGIVMRKWGRIHPESYEK